MTFLANLLDHKREISELLQSSRLGVMVDFDGTIAHMAPTPDEAVVSQSAARSLRRLAQEIALVCVVSGRAVQDLRDKVGEAGLTYVGNHGVEFLDITGLWVAPGALDYRSRVLEVVKYLRANADIPGIVWEDKRYGLSVHYRLAKDPGQANRDLHRALRSAPGSRDLDVFWGKMVLEIRPPLGFHKGYAVKRLARLRRLDGAIVIGDDTTDVQAISGLKAMKDHGELNGVGVAVAHPDSPADLMSSADYRLDGVSEVEAFLAFMVESVGLGDGHGN